MVRLERMKSDVGLEDVTLLICPSKNVPFGRWYATMEQADLGPIYAQRLHVGLHQHLDLSKGLLKPPKMDMAKGQFRKDPNRMLPWDFRRLILNGNSNQFGLLASMDQLFAHSAHSKDFYEAQGKMRNCSLEVWYQNIQGGFPCGFL